jgi:hypothetical protein
MPINLNIPAANRELSERLKEGDTQVSAKAELVVLDNKITHG